MRERVHPCIAVVDDEASLRRAVMKSLETRGMRVLSFSDARLCLEALPEESVTLVISDISMPGMDGITFLKEARAQYPTLPILMISGYADIPTAIECVKLGAYDFLEKPFDEDSLLPKVEFGLRTFTLLAESQLTEIEHRVLSLIAGGLSNKEVAFDIGKSIRTVEGCRQRITKKLGASSIPEAITIALKLKLL